MIIEKPRYTKCVLSVLGHSNFMNDINYLKSTVRLDKLLVVDMNST